MTDKPMDIYLMGGLLGFQWPFNYSAGLKVFAGKARALATTRVQTTILSYGDADIAAVVSAVRRLGKSRIVVIGGHSLGVRAAVAAATQLFAQGNIASLIVGWDGTWNAPPGPVPGAIPAIEFYNTVATSFLGHSKMFRADGSETGIRNIPNNVEHQNVDDVTADHTIVLTELQRLLAA